MSYKRRNSPIIPQEQDSLLQYVLEELEAIERSSCLFDFICLTKLYAEPVKLKEGLVVLADGTTWNPGSGAGVYAYYGGSWKKLG